MVVVKPWKCKFRVDGDLLRADGRVVYADGPVGFASLHNCARYHRLDSMLA